MLYAWVNPNEKATKGRLGRRGGLSALSPKSVFSLSLLPIPAAPRLPSLALFLDYCNFSLIHFPVFHPFISPPTRDSNCHCQIKQLVFCCCFGNCHLHVAGEIFLKRRSDLTTPLLKICQCTLFVLYSRLAFSLYTDHFPAWLSPPSHFWGRNCVPGIQDPPAPYHGPFAALLSLLSHMNLR